MLARLPLKTAEPRGTLWPVDRNRSDRRSETVAQHQQPAGERAYRSVEFDRPCLVVASTRFWAPGTFECRLGLVSAGGSRGPWCNRTRHPAWPGRARPRSSSPHRWSAARQGRPVLPPRPTTGPGAHGRPRRADGRWTTCGPAITTPPWRVPVCRRTSTGRPRVVDAVTAGEHRTDHRQRFRAAVRPMAAQAKPPVDDPTKVHPLRQHRRRQQAAFGTRFRSSKVVETRDRSWLARTQL